MFGRKDIDRIEIDAELSTPISIFPKICLSTKIFCEMREGSYLLYIQGGNNKYHIKFFYES